MTRATDNTEQETIETGLYRHYKGGLYKVFGTARHSETLELLVVYEALYKNDLGQLWVRPLSMFRERVQPGGPGSPHVPRFERITSIETDET
jgi:hypothetical protein